ncbi:MAG: PAS domain S-box protein, partial [Steroidobacteraceae bacterium]
MTEPAASPVEPLASLAELELRAVLDAAVDAVVVIDASGTIETFNRAAERLFGYLAAEVLGKNVSLLMPEPHGSRHDAYLGHHLQTGQ